MDNQSLLKKMNWKIFLLGRFKIPMIGYTKPKLLDINDTAVKVKVRLRRRTKNHLNSMYFGALSVGADITGGFLALPAIKNSNRKIALIFKDFNAKFLKRAESDVHFVCEDGKAVKNLVEKDQIREKMSYLNYLIHFF